MLALATPALPQETGQPHTRGALTSKFSEPPASNDSEFCTGINDGADKDPARCIAADT